MGERMVIDGSQGEGGGQILRTALALSLATGTPFRIERIRAGREKPGLLRQHLTAVQAAATIGGARVSGAELGSAAIEFEPGPVRGGEYRFTIGTAGSATLVLQAVLPALLTATEPTRLTIEGGTHNPGAPPFEFLDATFVPVLRRMGARIVTCFHRHGFFPAGGGQFTIEIDPSPRLSGIDLDARGDVAIEVRACIASLPKSIANRELDVVSHRLGIGRRSCRLEAIEGSAGPGNVLIVTLRAPEIVEVVTGFGVKGVSAETVAHRVCDEVERYLSAGVPVGAHLADQLLVPMALAGAGSFRTLALTPHTTTNIDVIDKFFPACITREADAAGAWRVRVDSRQK